MLVTIMKHLLITIFTFILLNEVIAQNFDDKYGIGIVEVHGISTQSYGYSTDFHISLYDTIGVNIKPVKTYNFNTKEDSYREKRKELNYLNLSYNLAYFVMVCLDKKGDWFKVRICDGQEYWTKNVKLTYYSPYNGKNRSISTYKFRTWAQFISNTIWVSRLDKEKNMIRNKANKNASIVKFDAPECLTAIKTKGYWLKITPSNGEGCFSGDNEDPFAIDYQKLYFKYGWIQWRDEKDFLIYVNGEM